MTQFGSFLQRLSSNIPVTTPLSMSEVERVIQSMKLQVNSIVLYFEKLLRTFSGDACGKNSKP